MKAENQLQAAMALWLEHAIIACSERQIGYLANSMMAASNLNSLLSYNLVSLWIRTP